MKKIPNDERAGWPNFDIHSGCNDWPNCDLDNGGCDNPNPWDWVKDATPEDYESGFDEEEFIST